MMAWLLWARLLLLLALVALGGGYAWAELRSRV
jgi:hypothetical protein